MPIYDYRCGSCGRRFNVFFRSFADVREPVCAHCGSASVSRLPARVRLARSEESRLEDLADPSSLGDLDERDPRSLARWARRMGREMGEDLGPDLDEAVDAMETGKEAPGQETGESDLGDNDDDEDDL